MATINDVYNYTDSITGLKLYEYAMFSAEVFSKP